MPNPDELFRTHPTIEQYQRLYGFALPAQPRQIGVIPGEAALPTPAFATPIAPQWLIGEADGQIRLHCLTGTVALNRLPNALQSRFDNTGEPDILITSLFQQRPPPHAEIIANISVRATGVRHGQILTFEDLAETLHHPDTQAMVTFLYSYFTAHTVIPSRPDVPPTGRLKA